MITINDVILAIRKVLYPDIPINVWDLGLIYDIDLNEANTELKINMTLASQESPTAKDVPEKLKNELQQTFPALAVTVNLVFDPIWTPDRLTEEGKRRLGIED